VNAGTGGVRVEANQWLDPSANGFARCSPNALPKASKFPIFRWFSFPIGQFPHTAFCRTPFDLAPINPFGTRAQASPKSPLETEIRDTQVRPLPLCTGRPVLGVF
jgi:hypothetical protein